MVPLGSISMSTPTVLTIISFALAVHILEKFGRKHFSFKHAIMVLALFVLVVFQVFVALNRPHLPPPPLIPSVKRKRWK